jgi:hypothetical protein
LLNYEIHGKLPIYVGITGHRQMTDQDVLRAYDRITALLATLKETYPHTPIVAVTPLAEGADRLLAYAAQELRMAYIVPMPCRESAYVAGFANDAAREEYHRLAGKADARYAVDDTDRLNADQYRKVGEHVARHADILIAVHAPERPDDAQKFGTKYVMRYWERMNQEDKWGFLADDTNAAGDRPKRSYNQRRAERLYSVPIDHASAVCGDLAGLLADKSAAPSDLDRLRSFIEDPVLREWDNYNADASQRRRANMLHQSWSRSQSAFAGLLAAKEPPLSDDPQLTGIAMRYHTADRLSIHYAKRRNRMHKLLTAMTFLLSLLLFIYQNSRLYNSIFIYFLVFAAAWLVYRWVSKQNYHQKFVVYRALAENLRILFYLRLMNRYPDSPFESHWKMNDQHDWINAAAMQQLRTCLGTSAPMPLKQALEQIKTHWVQGQAEYYRKQWQNQKRLQTRQQILSRTAAVLVLSAMLLLAVIELISITDAVRLIGLLQPSLIRDNLFMIFAMIGLWIALFDNYTKKMFAPETIRDYRQMRNIFSGISRRLKWTDDPDRPDSEQFAALIGDLHRLVQYAVNENDRWMNVKMEQDLEMKL